MIKVCNFQALIDNNYKNILVRKSPPIKTSPNSEVPIGSGNATLSGEQEPANFDMDAFIRSDSYLKSSIEHQTYMIGAAKPFIQDSRQKTE